MENMKRLLMIAVLSVVTALMAAAPSDLHLIFWTNGPDCYADGSAVLDGECYALVCTRAGSSFAGFNADGTLVNTDANTLVHVAPLAKNGRCRYTDFIVDADFANAHAADEWKVFLLDTRRRNGALAPRGDSGLPARINSYGATDGRVRFGSTFAAGLQGAALPGAVGSVTDQRSSADFAPPPRITDIRIVDGKAVLTVQDTVPSLDYDLAGGAKPGELQEGAAVAPAEGVNGRPIVLEAEAATAAGFFKVIRAK